MRQRILGAIGARLGGGLLHSRSAQALGAATSAATGSAGGRLLAFGFSALLFVVGVYCLIRRHRRAWPFDTSPWAAPRGHVPSVRLDKHED